MMNSTWILRGAAPTRDLPLHGRALTIGGPGADLPVDGIGELVVQLLVLPAKVVVEALAPGVLVDAAPLPAGSRRDLSPGDSLGIRGKTWILEQSVPAPAAEAAALLAIEPVLQVIESLLEAPDPAALLPRLLEAAVRHLGASGGVLLQGGDCAEPAASFPAGSPPRFSRSAVAACLRSGTAILWAESGSSDAQLEGPSLVDAAIRSILAAPLSTGGETRGCLYLHRTGGGPPFSEGERVAFARFLVCLERVLEAAERHHADRRLLAALDEGGNHGILATSPAMHALLAQARRFAQATVPLLILGETGTGKELLARLVHRSSARRDKPFVAVNCAAIPRSLMESELFGHLKGAFTGALADRAGLFESADGGTLFLDEIGELDLPVQAALLRALQEKTVRRLGASQETRIDVRIVAATHRPLEAMIESGTFRQDLFFRLNVATLRLPPLRERPEDVLPLAHLFAQRAARDFELTFGGLSRAAEKALMRRSWPGNVRELENSLQRAILEAGGHRIEPAHFGFSEEAEAPATLSAARESAERKAISAALARSGGNLTQAGAILGIDRKVLRDVLKRLGLDKEEFT